MVAVVAPDGSGTVAGMEDDRHLPDVTGPAGPLADPGAGAADDGSVTAAAAAVDAAAARARQITEEIAASERGESTALVPTTGTLPAEAVRTQMAEQRASLLHARNALDAARAELETRLANQLAEATAVLEPMREMVARLEDGIAAVALYLGRDEEIVTLADGEPAPAATPITVRQMVLYMDEETAINADDDGLDATGIEAFDAWLTSDPAHLAQVLPEERGVVVLAPRRRPKDYGDPWVNKARHEENRASYWLIRNGGLLYRMSTDIVVGTHLIPTRDEFTSFFTTRTRNRVTGEMETVPLDPGSHQWLRAEKAADLRQRHFMKTALVLQGLIDRTAVFHPLPAPQVSALTPDSYDAGHIRVVTDAELALGTSREPFFEWLARLNGQLRPGMRIVGNFAGAEFRDQRGYERGYRHERLSPENAAPPASGVIHTIERRRRDGSLVFLYERSDKRYGYEHGDYGRWGDWPYKQRASCTITASDRFVIPFDLVTVPEMRAYLEARTDRHAYRSLFPTLQAAIEAKEAEADEEAPFRALLAGEIARANDVDVESALDAVPGLVDWWKLSNKWHRPLVDPDPATQAKAIRMIVAEHAARTKAAAAEAGDTTVDATFAQITAEHPDALLVARKRDRSWIAYLAADAGNVFVHERTWTPTGRARAGRDWLFPNTRWATWQVRSTSERWAAWNHAPDTTRELSGPEFTALVPAVLAEAVRGAAATRGGNDDDVDGAGTSRGREPFAVLYSRSRSRFEILFDDVRDVVPADSLLSVAAPGVEITSIEVPWDRVGGQPQARFRERYWNPTTQWRHQDRWPWVHSDPFGHRNEPDTDPLEVRVPDGADHKGEMLVWVDRDRALAARARIDAIRAAYESAAPARALVSGAVTALSDAWEEREWAAAYQRFLEDYKDASLWEGHRKTITVHADRDVIDAVTQRLRVLVDAGEQVTGRSVAELDEAAAALVAAGAPIPSTSRWPRAELAELAEDWLDLVVPDTVTGDDD